MIQQSDKKKLYLKPLENRVVVQRLEEKETLKGGIIIPDTAKKKQEMAKVIAIGEGKKTDAGKLIPCPVAIGRFIVSYRVIPSNSNADISQTKNLSLGGMLLTTNCQFPIGTNLALEIRLPFDPNPITIMANVLESSEISKGLIYDTRLNFLAVDEKHRKIIGETVGYYIKKGSL